MTATDRDRMLLDEGAALRRLARSLLATADVDDVVQQTFATALAEPHAGAGYLRPWLRVTLRRLAASLRRAESRRTRRQRSVAVPEAQFAADPALVAQQAELIRDVGDAVHALHEPFRTVVVMRFWRGMLPEAIAQELALPRNTVRSQLQRGVEMLRARLDARYGMRERWAAPLGVLVGVRAAVPAAVTGGGVLWIVAGVLMQAKLLLGAGAVLVAAMAIPWYLAGERGAPPSRTDPATPPAVVAAATTSPPTNERIEVATPSPTANSGAPVEEGPFDPSPVHVQPWSPDLLVVDQDDVPVVGASIEVFAGTKVERTADVRKRYGGSRHSYSGHDTTPCMQLETDANGRARPVLELENYCFAARKDGLGCSLEAVSWNTRTVELKLVLVQRLVARGRVLRADGLPAAGARVTAGPSWSPTAQIAPEPVVTDAEGRFELSLQGRGSWSFGAWLDGQGALPLQLKVASDPVPEIQLVFPGAITVSGIVLDPDGNAAVGATVRLWREYHLHDPQQDTDDYEATAVDTDSSGRFAIPVQRCARYQVLASHEHHATSNLVWTETTIARPHAEVGLQLQRFAEIRGTVVHEDGSPYGGVKVFADAEAGEAAGYLAVPTRRDLFPSVRPAISGEDGAFALAVHPGTSWRIITRPVPGNWYLGSILPGVAPGQSEVVLRVTGDDLGGCTVRCRVVRAADGTPIANCGFELISCDAKGRPSSSAGIDAAVDGDCFRLEPLPCGRRFGLRIISKEPGVEVGSMFGPLAPTEVEPFTTTRQGLELVVRLEAWGDLPVRVLAADGSVPRNLSVYASSELMRTVSYPSLHLDAEGRVLLQQRNPGVHHLRVLAGGDRLLLEQDVSIVPGRNQEILVRLPVTAAK